ncbi:hypothetical protein MAR_026166 [Mya arenaria]|uniref:Uncharacterized protein n=1 Tax=Mya arenaria TaxID=6604 RepID=A0ABY7ET48_MYAAR|nr:hypothetical protein MAR_026166 [Mya arenaria]
MLQSSITTKKCRRVLVFRWHRRFREGRCCIEDDDRIVTTDITWLWDLDPETKAQSCIWKTPETSSRIKARGHKSGSEA